MMSVQNVPMRITSLRKEAKRDLAAFAPKMHQRAGLGANFRGSCNCIILDMATDPAMGSGSLLLTVRDELLRENKLNAIKFYGQELNTTTYNFARMNLMMHDVSYNNMYLCNADTLEMDWPDGPDEKGIDHPRSFDAVVANPPYSAKWDNRASKMKDERFRQYGKLAPASKADYAFILHSVYHLNHFGTMAIVLPHGVLFRGAAEGKIRQALIEKNYLDAVIGLPANLFYGTSIPTVILVLKKIVMKKVFCL